MASLSIGRTEDDHVGLVGEQAPDPVRSNG
jgi:hypothetical protein